jgi:hypothetical protein
VFAVRTDVEAFVRVVCPSTLSVPDEVRPVDDALPKVSLPVVSIAKREDPVEEATLNGLVPAVPCTLKVYVDEVALTPDTVPLSRSSPVESVVGEVKRARYPLVPPDTPAPPVIPRDEVATHRVEVPVARSTSPSVPRLEVLS